MIKEWVKKIALRWRDKKTEAAGAAMVVGLAVGVDQPEEISKILKNTENIARKTNVSIEEAAEEIAKIAGTTAMSAKEVGKALDSAIRKKCWQGKLKKRKETNNWRKMHSLPMRRKKAEKNSKICVTM